MTGGRIGAKDRPKEIAETMESGFTTGVVDHPPYIYTCGDLPLSTDFADASIYASSPNSLHIYEQEKLDMQSTMGINTTCTSMDTGTTTDDFDLKAQYEVSQDISSYPLTDVSATASQNTISSMMQNAGEVSVWSDSLKPANQDLYIKVESPDVSAPTLAELNMNVDLLDDIESYINFEMNVSSSAPETIVKQEPGHILEKERSFDLVGQAGGSVNRVSSTSRVQYTPSVASMSVVKTEPVETSGSCWEKYQKSFTPMTPVKPELVVPQVVTEAKAPLTTIKEIDISDFTTLQRLLNTQPSQARVSRKRTVSEPQTVVKPVSRKRSVGSAGLDSMELKWEEIKHFLHMETQNIGGEVPAVPTVKRERTRYDSTSSVMTLTSNEDDDSDSDKDFDDDSDSDLEGGHDIGSLSPSESLIGTKEKQYFWQYNVQSKGPKGTRVKFELEEDPHVLNDFEDPVFGSTSTGNLSGIGVSIKHGGKARKGDGNDIVPSPKKLCQIGLQLRKINKQINDFVPLGELPSQARSKSRKEKNKLASRACRLKKKAQHEANKIKLHGLELEHRRLLTVIHLIRQRLYQRLKKMPTDDKKSMSEVLEALIKEHLGEMVGGHTTDFVNSVIHKVEAGDWMGGISVHATRSYPKELHN
ncbi:protein CREBRF homolog [Mercenaria mercenaria]|uniref:protein CREBRF homolog n=1 Tax=Mercenaria mercenaria TaxID=6596 RepID=UPI00234F107D|nr:protein CREBRF homolog [Mercenaria mercenaria]